MDEPHDRLLLRSFEDDVVLHVAEVHEVLPPRFFGSVFNYLSDVEPLTLNVPSFVVVARDELGCNTVPLRPVGDKVVHLSFHPMYEEVELVEPRFTVNHIAELVDGIDALLRPDVEQGVENIHPLVPAAEMVIGGQPETNERPFELRHVDFRWVALRDVA